MKRCIHTIVMILLLATALHAAAGENRAAIADAAAINKQELWVKPENPVAPGSEKNPSLILVQKMFDAYAKGDTEALKEVVAEDVEWHIPGRHPLAGTKRGLDELGEFFTALHGAGFRAEVMILAANDNYVIDAHRGWSNSGKGDVDLNWVLLYQIIDGKIRRIQNFSGDQYVSDKFFTEYARTLKEEN